MKIKSNKILLFACSCITVGIIGVAITMLKGSRK